MKPIASLDKMTSTLSTNSYLLEPRLTVELVELTDNDQDEVLAFLAAWQVEAVVLSGIIRDNGLVSANNRGTFYACRNSSGRLEGVALIGHSTLIEAHTKRAVQLFAQVAQRCKDAHLILGEKYKLQEFWNYYAEQGQDVRLACRELLFELRTTVDVSAVAGLRLANPTDLDRIVPIQAAMAERESGISPIERDPAGFRGRCLRRIEMNRVWVLEQDGELVFKADLQAVTPEVIYLEGVWVNDSTRGRGIGSKCLHQLCEHLLTSAKCICVLVNEDNLRAQACYRACGFKMRGVYQSIFLS